MSNRRLNLLTVIIFLASSSLVFGGDTGVLKHFLNLDAKLPQRSEALAAEQASEAVIEHISKIQSGVRDVDAMTEYWSDYRSVLSQWTEVSSAKPVLISKEDGTVLIARYLVGLVKDGQVGGFWAVHGKTGAIQSELLWTDDFAPLWRIPAKTWENAGSVNDIEELAELVAPFSQFTTGIPIDPNNGDATIIDGVVDVLPLKTQEERRERVEWFNETHGTDLQVALKAHKGRRTASSKCMSVAASYLGDWWTVRTSGALPTYTNGVGGQKEYGFNPRLLECIFYARRKEQFIKFMGNFKTAPFSKDRVTGEPIPYSPRGYARILNETNSGVTKDNLVPTLVQYETNDNHFAMDQKPLIYQIFTTGLFPRRAIKKDLKNAKDPDFPFSLAENYGEAVSVADIAVAIDRWGPMLAQHMGRNKDGSPKTGKFGMGVHCVTVVGTAQAGGKDMLVYRETFGPATHDYLEDSFMGPAFRMMPIEYFYQAIAFPHHLYVKLDGLKYADDASLVGTITVTTNRGKAPVDVDDVHVFVDGKLATHGRAKPLGNGKYQLWLPISVTKHSKRIEVRVTKKYFADKAGNNAFGVAAERPEKRWSVVKGNLEPIKID